MGRAIRYWVMALLMAAPITGALAQTSSELADLRASGGPRTLVITYRCDPDKRPAFRERIQKEGVARFEQWKRQGMLKEYRLLFNWYVDQATWDLMSELTFPSYKEVAKWREIERTMPGGLTKEELVLAKPLNTYSFDLRWHDVRDGSPDPNAANHVYYVIPYVYDPTPLEVYMGYADKYVIPQIERWIKAGVLSGYRIYIIRYPTFRPWQVLFLLEYKDADAWGHRETEMAKARADLLEEDPSFHLLVDLQNRLRIEKETVIADRLLPAQ